MFDRRFLSFYTVLILIMLSAFMTVNVNAEDEVNNRQPRSIQVSGNGKVAVVPDKADLTLAIEAQGKTAEAVRNQAAKAMTALIDAVKNANVADKDIQTHAVSLYPTYSSDTANKIIGYQLTNQVAVVVRDINKLGEIMDSAVQAGGNLTRIQGVNFSVDDPSKAIAEARGKAYADAKAKAGQYADLAGLKLGSPVHISEGSHAPPRPMPYGEMRAMKAEMADSAPTPIQVGEQEVSVTVDVMFGLGE